MIPGWSHSGYLGPPPELESRHFCFSSPSPGKVSDPGHSRRHRQEISPLGVVWTPMLVTGTCFLSVFYHRCLRTVGSPVTWVHPKAGSLPVSFLPVLSSLFNMVPSVRCSAPGCLCPDGLETLLFTNWGFCSDIQWVERSGILISFLQNH